MDERPGPHLQHRAAPDAHVPGAEGKRAGKVASRAHAAVGVGRPGDDAVVEPGRAPSARVSPDVPCPRIVIGGATGVDRPVDPVSGGVPAGVVDEGVAGALPPVIPTPEVVCGSRVPVAGGDAGVAVRRSAGKTQPQTDAVVEPRPDREPEVQGEPLGGHPGGDQTQERRYREGADPEECLLFHGHHLQGQGWSAPRERAESVPRPPTRI